MSEREKKRSWPCSALLTAPSSRARRSASWPLRRIDTYCALYATYHISHTVECVDHIHYITTTSRMLWYVQPYIYIYIYIYIYSILCSLCIESMLYYPYHYQPYRYPRPYHYPYHCPYHYHYHYHCHYPYPYHHQHAMSHEGVRHRRDRLHRGRPPHPLRLALGGRGPSPLPPDEY